MGWKNQTQIRKHEKIEKYKGYEEKTIFIKIYEILFFFSSF